MSAPSKCCATNWQEVPICDAPAVASYWQGCIHEHGEVVALCGRHLPLLVESWLCKACRDILDGGHVCRITFQPLATVG